MKIEVNSEINQKHDKKKCSRKDTLLDIYRITCREFNRKVHRSHMSLHFQTSDIIIPNDRGSLGSIKKQEGKERKQEKLIECRHLLGRHYHLSPSGVASLYKFLYVLGSSITKRTRGTDTTARTLNRGGDRDARKSLEGGGVRSFVVSFVRRSVGSFVRPSVRPSVVSFGGTGPVIGPKLLAPLDRPKIIHPHVPRAQSQTFLCDILCCRYLYLIHEVKPA